MLKPLIVAAFLTLPLAGYAASPEDAYLAARDRYVATFKKGANGKNEKALYALHDKALKDLGQRLKPVIGPFAAPGFPIEGRLNLISLFPDDIDGGLLDGLVYGEGGDAKIVIVTTDGLLDKWLLGHRDWRAKDGAPISAAAAVKTEDFYTQGIMSDATVANYGEVPVTAPPGAKFAHAMLALAGNGVLVPGAPDRILVALEQNGRVFIVNEKLETPVALIPACDAAGAEQAKRADALDKVFMDGGGKNKKQLAEVEKLRSDADHAVCACFAGKVRDMPAFKAAGDQAAAIVAALTGK
jgi:hypothetical protein